MPGGKTRNLGNAVLFLKTNADALKSGLKDAVQRVGAATRTIGVGATIIGGALTGAFLSATKAAIEFESAFAGVRKTVDASDEEFAQLEQNLLDMSERLPSSAAELAGIMEIAGQLGIDGVENLTAFTETIARLADSTNIVGETGTLQLARFMNVMGTATGDVDRLGAAIVDLGNNFAAQEAEILFIAKGLAAFGNEVGLTETEVLALATTIAASGGQAEAATSAFQRLGAEMKTAVLGDRDADIATLKKFADIAGVSADTFRKKFKEDALGTIEDFLRGLKRIQDAGGDTGRAIGEIFSPESGKAPIRLVRELGKVTANLDDLKKATDLSAKAFEENTALIEESEKRYDTFAAQLEITKNKINNLQKTIGDILAPKLKIANKHLSDAVNVVRDWIKLNPELAEKITLTTAAIGGFLVALGPLLIVLPSIVSGIGAIISILGSPFTIAIAAVIGAVVLLRKAWQENLFDIQGKAEILKQRLIVVFDAVVAKLRSVRDWFVDLADKAIAAFRQWKEANQKDIDELVAAFNDAFIPIWEAVKKAFLDAWEGIKEWWDKNGEELKTDIVNAIASLASGALGLLKIWSRVWPILSNIVTTFIAAVKFPLEQFWIAISGLFTFGLAAISGNWSRAFDVMLDTMTSFFGNALDSALEFVGRLDDLLGSIVSVVNPFDSKIAFAGDTGGLAPRAAAGGGASAAGSPTGGLSAAGAMNVTINIDGNVIGNDEFARQMANQIARLARDGRV